uniref:Uncharacterized protein n=1 Tax=Cacopsylla melanoneura TaxID=428564 RepID=A0A8D9BFU0_9HEMI
MWSDKRRICYDLRVSILISFLHWLSLTTDGFRSLIPPLSYDYHPLSDIIWQTSILAIGNRLSFCSMNQSVILIRTKPPKTNYSRHFFPFRSYPPALVAER